MSMRYYISTEEASFFNNNSMGYGTGVPTSGTYKVGDFIISSKQENGIFGWVCVKAGTPGEWDVIGSGFAGGSGGGNVVVGYINSVSFNNTRNSIEIGIPEFNKGIDFLEVHYNGLLLAEGVHYNVSSDGLRIESIDGSWNESANDTQQMIFRVLKSEGVKVKEYKNTVDIDNACYEVEHGIPQYNSQFDIIEVHLNGVLLVEGLDYRIENDKLIKIDSNEAWNPYNVQGQKMFIKVMRNVSGMVEVTDNSVGVDKLTPELAENIEAIDDLLDIVGIQNTNISNMDNRIAALEEKEVEIDLSGLQTQNKDLVGAINELFQNANNGKELIANAIGEPLDSSDTFQAMSNDINSLLSTFKTNMMKNGVTVESGDKFKALIDKISYMSESGNKGIKFASGVYGNASVNNSLHVITIDANLDFIPTHLFIQYSQYYTSKVLVDVLSENPGTSPASSNRPFYCEIYGDFNPQQFQIKFSTTYTIGDINDIAWYAIGVGEEDTTLRDSLANILGDKGVDISPEDDMATLIGKVDSIKGGSLDIISATELPATGKQNQICVITDNPVDKFLLSGNYNDKTTDDTIFIYTNSSSEESILYEIGENIVTRYYISSIYQGDTSLSSYTYNNGIWNKLTSNSLVFFSGSYYNNGVFGDAVLGGSSLNTNGWSISSSSLFAAGLISTNVIDFSKYNAVKIRGYVTSNITQPLDIYVGSNTLTSSYMDNAWSGMMMPFGSTQYESYYFTNYTKFTIPTGAIVPNVEFETDIDISSITGGYRFRLGISSQKSNFANNGGDIVITSLELLL